MVLTAQLLILIEICLVLSIVTYFLGVYTIKHRLVSDKFISLSKHSIGDRFIAGFMALLFISVVVLIIISIYMMIFHMNVINL